MDFSRPSLRVVKPTNINRIVKEALNIVQYGKKVKDITFTLDLDEHLPEIAAVPDQIVQVFINILMNAVDSLDERRGSITVTLQILRKVSRCVGTRRTVGRQQYELGAAATHGRCVLCA